eukprot:619080-Hanusia_phi.AAC.1
MGAQRREQEAEKAGGERIRAGTAVLKIIHKLQAEGLDMNAKAVFTARTSEIEVRGRSEERRRKRK